MNDYNAKSVGMVSMLGTAPQCSPKSSGPQTRLQDLVSIISELRDQTNRVTAITCQRVERVLGPNCEVTDSSPCKAANINCDFVAIMDNIESIRSNLSLIESTINRI